MQNITIKIQGYGAIERELPADLSVQCQMATPVAEVIHFIARAYPDAAALLKCCACAIEDNMISRQTELNTDRTLVLLSPVAGG